MKIIAIGILLLGLVGISTANTINFLDASKMSHSKNIRLEENNLGPINPGSADNY